MNNRTAPKVFLNLVIILSSLAHLNKTTISEYSTHWDELTHVFFLILFSGSSKDKNEILKFIWNIGRLLTFIVVLFHGNKECEILTYNPFNDSIVQCSTEDLFFSKMKNLYQFQFNVTVFNDNIGTVVSNGECVKGRNCQILKEFFKLLNGSFRLLPGITDYDQSIGMLDSGLSEIAFNPMFIPTVKNLIYVSYPYETENIVAIVRNTVSDLPYAAIVNAFDLNCWICIVIITITIKFVKQFFNQDSSFDGLLIITHSLFVLLITNIFQSVIIKNLFFPASERLIETIDDLVASGLPVYVDKYLALFVNVKLKRNIIPNLNYDIIEDMVISLNGTGAFLLKQKWVMEFFLEDADRMNYYYQLKETVGTNYFSHYLQPKSPFKQTFKQILLRIQCLGLDHVLGVYPPQIHKTSSDSFVVPIRLYHLRGLMFMFIDAYIFGLILLIIEMLYKKCTN